MKTLLFIYLTLGLILVSQVLVAKPVPYKRNKPSCIKAEAKKQQKIKRNLNNRTIVVWL